MLTPRQIEHFKRVLTHEKQELERSISNRETEDRQTHSESIGELSLYDNHPGDIATELYEREKDFGLLEFHHKQLEDVKYALARIEAGNYGICEVSGEIIPLERLEAMPTAVTTKEHANDRLLKDSRPVEEEIITTVVTKKQRDSFIGYDAEDSWQDVASYGTSDTPSDLNGQDYKEFNTMYTNSDDPRGVVEDFENFIGTDIYGKNPKAYLGDDHEAYEQMLDNNEVSPTNNKIKHK